MQAVLTSVLRTDSKSNSNMFRCFLLTTAYLFFFGAYCVRREPIDFLQAVKLIASKSLRSCM